MASKRRQKANPIVYQHPDFFVGESPVRVAIDDLTIKQLKSLPRKNYTDEEWGELHSDITEHIYQHDSESMQRVEELKIQLQEVTEHLVDLDTEFAMPEAESGIDDELADAERLMERAKQNGDYANIRAEFPDGDEWDEAFDEAFKEVLSDWNMYEFDVESYDHYGGSKSCLLYVPVYNSIYIEWHRMDVDPESIYRDEVERALDELTRGAEDYFEIDEIYDSLNEPMRRHRRTHRGPDAGAGYQRTRPPFEKSIDYVGAVCGVLQDDKAAAEMKELIDEPDVEPEWAAAPPEERVVHRFDDGFYVQRLAPDELAAEGKAMRMCIGRDDMGYTEAVRRGEIQILSLRTPAGRPKFTLEVEMDGGKIKSIAQIKGKSNRLPGFDLGKAESRIPGKGIAAPKMKLDEVAKLFEVVNALGIQPRSVYDLGPAIIHLRRHSKGPEVMKKLFPGAESAYGTTAYEQIEEIMELLDLPGIHLRNNPMRQPGRGESPRTFDMPYKRRRL